MRVCNHYQSIHTHYIIWSMLISLNFATTDLASPPPKKNTRRKNPVGTAAWYTYRIAQMTNVDIKSCTRFIRVIIMHEQDLQVVAGKFYQSIMSIIIVGFF